MNMMDLLKKLFMALIIWVLYTLEILMILIFFDRWLNFAWFDSALTGDPFFNGVAWFIMFIFITLFLALGTLAGITDDLS